MKDEFYIGWEANAAPGVAKAVRRTVCGLILLLLAVALVLAASQRLVGVSVFEWGNLKHVSGILQVRPTPILLVPRPGRTGDARYSTYYLVAPWKFGLNPAALSRFDGKSVDLKGTFIYRANETMIETRPEWIQANRVPAAADLPRVIPLGRQTLVGEIVDSKCFLGVMNPGQLTPHRACAIRCISGGCPPLLVVRQTDGPPVCLLLVSTHGEPVNRQVLDLVAEPVSITGEVERQGDLLILRADPETYRRIR